MARPGNVPSRRRALRTAAGILVAWLSCSEPAQAVIPGLAPGLAAVLPQILFFLVALFALLFSPRAWGRLLVQAWRHPAWTAGAVSIAALLVVGLPRLADLFPGPAAGAEIPGEVHGFLVGDARAARSRSLGPGPIGEQNLEVTRLAPGGAGGSWEPGELSGLGADVLVLSTDRRRIALFDPRARRILWERALEAPASRSPVGFSRRLPGGEETRGILLLAGEILVLDGSDGAVRKRLPGGGAEALAIVDGRLLLAGAGSIEALSLDPEHLLERLWTAPRPARRAVDLAGDDQRRYFLLDAQSLHACDLAGGPLRELGKFEGPLRLAVRGGLAYVLDRRSDGQTRLVSLDPARQGRGDRLTPGDGGAVWARDVEPTIDDDFALGPSGAVLTHQRSIEVLDLETGVTLRRVALDSSASCPAAAERFSIFAGLSEGRSLRYSFALDRVVWTSDPPTAPGESGRREARSLLSVGDQLVVSAGGKIEVLSGASRDEGAPWGQWRGGPGRTGTSDGERVPLSGRVLWRREAGGVNVRLLPLPDGWIAARASGNGTFLEWIDDRGASIGSASIEGACAGLARLHGRIFAAVKRPGGDQVACLSAERPEGAPARLAVLWSLPCGTLGEREALSVDRDTLVMALAGSVAAASALDGRRLWESPPVEGVEAPLVAGGRAYVAGRDPGRGGLSILGLGLETGEVRWKAGRAGERAVALAVAGDVLHALLVNEKNEGRVLALSAAGGSVRWEREVDRPGHGPLVISEGRILFHNASGVLVILSETGEITGRLPDPGAGLAVPPPPVAGRGVLLVSSGRALRLLDSSTFDIAWEVELPAPAGPFALERGQVLVPSGTEILCVGAGE